MSKRSLEGTAYHEAGHAVMRCFNFLKFAYVSIIPRPSDDLLGHVRHHRSAWKNFDPEIATDLKTIDRTEKEIISNLAGPIAEKIFSGRYNWRGSEEDRSHALKLASYLCGNEKVLNAYWNYVWIRTEESLKARPIWFAVQGLASELLIKKKIGYREARDIIMKLPDEK